MSILLIESDDERRTQFSGAMRAAGMAVVATSSIAEVERWPAGDVVVTDLPRFSPWWKAVGASRVIVLVETPEQGVEACLLGASAWLLRCCRPDDLIRAVSASPRIADVDALDGTAPPTDGVGVR